MPQGLRAAITSKTPVAMTVLCAGEIARSDNYQKLAEGKPLVGRSAPMLSSKRRRVTISVSEFCPSYRVLLAAAIWKKSLSHCFYRQSVISCLCLNSP